MNTRWAEQYLKIPFRDRGATRSGCDCWGLLVLILAEQRGIVIPDYADEVEAGDWKTKMREITTRAESGAQWAPVEAGAEQPFDGVLMRGQYRDDGRLRSRPVHVGLVLEPGRLIHAEAGAGVTIVDYRRDPSIRCRLISFYRWKEAA